MPMLTVTDTTAVDTTDTDVLTDTTVARGLLMPPPKMLMHTTDTVDTMVDTVDTTDTLTDTDTTEARGPLKLKPHPKLMLTTDTDTVVDTDTVDTDTVDTDVDTFMVELLLKQTNKPLKLQLSGSSHSKFFQFGYNAKNSLPPYFFLKHENSLFFPIELES